MCASFARSCLGLVSSTTDVVLSYASDLFSGTRGYPSVTPDSRPVAVFTDLEPDGLVALHFLRRRGFVLRWVCVGEGDVRHKAATLRKHLSSLDSAGMEIVLGEGGSGGGEGEQDGDGMDGDGDRESDAHAELRINAMLYSLMELSETCTSLLLLKKPAEVLRALATPSTMELAKMVFGKFDVQVASDCTYGDMVTTPLFNPTVTPFKSVTIFYADHSGATASSSSLASWSAVSATSAPDVVAALCSAVPSTPFVPVLRAIIARHMIAEHEQARNVTYAREEDQRRHEAYVDNLKSGGVLQFPARNVVLATICYHRQFNSNVHVKRIAPPCIRMYANLTWVQLVSEMAALV